MGFGVAILFYSPIATFIFGSLAIIPSLLFFFGENLTSVVAVALVVGVGYVVWLLIRVPRLRKYLSKRYLLPYGVVGIFAFLTYIAIISGIQIEYAVPATFIIAGFLLLKGLRRFAVTIPTLIVLLLSMLILGAAVAGMYTVTYVPENRYLTRAQVPDADTVNLQVKSVVGNIRVYFTNDQTQVCHIAFIKEYGPIVSDRGEQYHDKSSYDTETATSFNYTVENREANVTTWSYTVLVNITLNQNLKYNLNFDTYYGDITINVPVGVNSIQSTNLTSQIGNVKIINGTTYLQAQMQT